MSEATPPPKEYRCPACGHLIYSRRRKKCEVCELPYPPEFLLTAEELEALEQEQREIHARRERDKAKDEEERKKQAAAVSFMPPIFPS
jgi:hypothetical protein